MPKYLPQIRWHERVFMWVAGFAVLGGLAYLLLVASWTQLATGAVLTLAFGLWVRRDLRKTQGRLDKIAEERTGESICQFARSFDCKKVDTWVVRAVYEELEEFLQSDRPRFPVRATDNLELDLMIDLDDLNMMLAEPIAARTGRTLDGAEGNLLWGKVRTAGDLVMFFNAQPLVRS